MTTSLSPEIKSALKALAEIPGVEIAQKFKIRQGMLCIGQFGSAELRLVHTTTTTGEQASVFIEKLRAHSWFSVSIGGPRQSYGHIEVHKVISGKSEVPFYTLPGGAYAKEFIESFSPEISFSGLLEVQQTGWLLTLGDKQIEIPIPSGKSESEVIACVSTVLKAATQAPYVQR